MSADPLDLTTVANLQAWLRLANVSTETGVELQRLVTSTSNWIQSWLSRTIPDMPYTDTLDGQGGARLSLGNYPVLAVSSVVVDGRPEPWRRRSSYLEIDIPDRINYAHTASGSGRRGDWSQL